MTKKRPPNQWKPGQTGNPKGRPPGSCEVSKLRAAIADRLALHRNQGFLCLDGFFVRVDALAGGDRLAIQLIELVEAVLVGRVHQLAQPLVQFAVDGLALQFGQQRLRQRQVPADPALLLDDDDGGLNLGGELDRLILRQLQPVLDSFLG